MTSFSAKVSAPIIRAIYGVSLTMACAFGGSIAVAEEIKGSADAAREKVSMCIGCHGIPGYRASFPEVYSVPKIAGQNEKYLIVALKAYASGERSQPTMDAISKTLSDQDMADLAAYYSNLK